MLQLPIILCGIERQLLCRDKLVPAEPCCFAEAKNTGPEGLTEEESASKLCHRDTSDGTRHTWQQDPRTEWAEAQHWSRATAGWAPRIKQGPPRSKQAPMLGSHTSPTLTAP